VAEYGASGGITARYLRGINLIARDQDNLLQYYLFNAHGDITQRTDQNGTALKNYDYDAFGVEKNPEILDVNPWRYCGEYADAETGTVYLRARYYDPRIGRFSAEDVARDGLNWYTYCGNNPLMFVDATGCKPYTYSIGHPWDSNNLYSFVVTPGWYDGMKTGVGWLPYGISLANPVHDGVMWGLAGWSAMDSSFVSTISAVTMDTLSNFTEWGKKLGYVGSAINAVDAKSYIDYMLSAEYVIDQAMYYHIKSMSSNAFVSTTREGAASKYNYVKDAIRPLVLSGELEVKSGSELFGNGNNGLLNTYVYNNYVDPLTGSRGTFFSDGFYFAKTDADKDYSQWLWDLLNGIN